jgi:hypothetical protein
MGQAHFHPSVTLAVGKALAAEQVLTTAAVLGVLRATVAFLAQGRLA